MSCMLGSGLTRLVGRCARCAACRRGQLACHLHQPLSATGSALSIVDSAKVFTIAMNAVLCSSGLRAPAATVSRRCAQPVVCVAQPSGAKKAMKKAAKKETALNSTLAPSESPRSF